MKNARAALMASNIWQGRCGGLFLTATLTLSAAPALASANVDCSIDDKFITFEMEAIAGRTGPINQVNVGSITLKPAIGIKLASPELTFDRTHISQQWLYDGELKLDIETYDEKTHESVVLIILAKLDKKTEKFAGTYVLRLARDQMSKEVKGRIKECLAG